jgi:hypothetical protein
MHTITLSESAVATLRLRMRGHKLPVNEQRLPAYRELAEAGIMEPVDGTESEFRFTPEGMEHRDEILEREQERIERERYAPPDGNLSESAREQLRRHLAGDGKVTEQTRPAYRELEAARIMIPSHPFVGGEGYRLTYWGWKLKDELIACSKQTA